MEKLAPSGVGKGGFPKAMRLATAVGAFGGFLYFYQRSIRACFLVLFHMRSDDSNVTTTQRSSYRDIPVMNGSVPDSALTWQQFVSMA